MEISLPSRTRIVGVNVSRTSYDETTRLVLDAAKSRQPLIVSALAVHGLMTGALHRDFRDVLNRFDVLTPDGQPVRWALNWFGSPVVAERVYGPTLMLRICASAAKEGVGIYLFGSRGEVLEALRARLLKQFPSLRIVGMHADRFRDATAEEDAADVAEIKKSGAGIVFCGRGCPLQERWCDEHRESLGIPLIAVGAAFDFHAGTLPQAPAWMQARGLEWLFRLIKEPRRLWRRYLLLNPLFLACLLLQACGVKFQSGGMKASAMKREEKTGSRSFMTWLIMALPFVAAVILFGLMGNSHERGQYGPSVLSWLVLQWLDPGSNAAHGWLIPLVSAFVVWRKRKEILQAPRTLDKRGLVLIVMFLFLYWAGYRAQQTRLGVLSFIGLLWSVPFYLFGPAVARLILFPCAYLVFAMPLGFLLPFTFDLRLASCTLATWLLQGLAIPAIRHGTAIFSSDGSFPPFDVADPCSGLNSLIALTALTAAYAYFAIKPQPLRWLMLASAIPIAMLGNVVRISVIVVAARLFGADVAMRVYHDYSGYIVFVVAVLLMTAFGSLLNSRRLGRWLTRSKST